MSDVLSIVRLRWTMQISALRKNPRALASFVLGLLFALVIILIAALCGWYGNGISVMFRSAMVMLGLLVMLGALMMQVMMLGQGSTLSPSKFELYGIGDGRLTVGLLAARLSGVPSITVFVTLLMIALSYRSYGAAAVTAGVVCAIMTVITMFAMTSTLTALLSSVSFSKKGRNILYMVVFGILTAIGMLSNYVNEQFTSALLMSDTSAVVRNVVAWTPFAASFQIPFDVIDGAWLAAAARVIILLATWVVCYLICTWHLRMARSSSGGASAKSGARKRHSDMFRFMPNSVSGAVSARLALYLRRDIRQIPVLAIPVVLMAFAVTRATESPDTVWLLMGFGALLVSVYESNGIACDGQGFYMVALSGISGWNERIGRARVHGVLITVYMFLMMIAAFVITGYWKTPELVMRAVAFTAVSIAVGWCSVGVAEVVSCVAMYPVASIERPFSSPQGRGILQLVFPLIQVVVSLVTVLPSVLMLFFLLRIITPLTMGAVIAVALVNGVVVLLGGSWLGGKLLDARMPKILATLDDFASLQQ